MKAENQLQWMMDFYPDLFPTRKHCLDHLFCVIGNGFEWVNGELVDNDEHSKRYKMIQDIEHAHGMCEDQWYANLKLHKRLQKIHPDCKMPRSLQFEWYPLSKDYSFLYDYPVDRKTLFGNVVKKCIQCSRTSEKRNNIVKKFKYSASYFELYTKFTPNEKDFRCGFQISYEP